MAFTVESTQCAIRACKEILVIENQLTFLNDASMREQRHRLCNTLETLLSLVTDYKDEIGALHILGLCNRLLGVTRKPNIKQLVISFGIAGLGRLLDNSISDLRIHECADVFNKLFSQLPIANEATEKQSCLELLQALSTCVPVLSSAYVPLEVQQSILSRLEYFILNLQDDTLLAVELYCKLLGKGPSNINILAVVFTESTDVELMIKVLVAVRPKFSKEELSTAATQVTKHLFSSPKVSPHAILSFCEILHDLEDTRVCDMFGLLLDVLVQTVIKGLDTTMNIETSDTALTRPLEKLELRRENIDALLTYLRSPESMLREQLANYILDSLLAVLNFSELNNSNTATLILLYLELLEQTDVYSNILYTDSIYVWLAGSLTALAFEEIYAHPYWYKHSSLMYGHKICGQCPNAKPVWPQLASIVRIVTKALPTHMLSQIIDATAENTFSRVILLSNILIGNAHYANHETLIKTLLNSFNIIIHYHPIPAIIELANDIVRSSSKLSDPDEISTDKALLLMMCVFYGCSTTEMFQHNKMIEACSTAAAEYVSTAFFEAFHLSADALNLSVKSLLVILITSLHYAPISSLPLITGIRNILISRWNKIVAIEGSIFNQTNLCLYVSLLSIIEYYKRRVDPIILIVNTQIQEYASLDLFQELPSMSYPQDLTEEGFNRCNDGENVAFLTSFGHALLVDDWGKHRTKLSAQHLSALSCFGDSLALILPILMRGLNDTSENQDTATMVLVTLYGTVHVQIKAALQLFSLSQIPLPYKLVYRIDPYHDAMMPRGYKSNDPRTDDQTYNLLLSLRMKASALFVDENGRMRLQAADTDWLSWFRNGRDASRTILHNCFDAFFFRAQQASVSQDDRLLLMGGLSFAEALLELDAEYLRSKKVTICNTLHHLFFFSSAVPLPHILYLLQRRVEDPGFKASFADILALVRSEEPYNQKIVVSLEKNKGLVKLVDVSISLFAQLSQDFSKAAPPIAVLDILSFFCCKHHHEKIINTAHSIIKLFIANYVPWSQIECPSEETIEGAAARLPIYDGGVSIAQGDVRQWAKAVLSAGELLEACESLDVSVPSSSNRILLQQYLNPSVWQAYSSVTQNAIEVLGQNRDAQTFVEQKHSNLERQRMCLYMLVDKEIKRMLRAFVENK